MFFVDTFGGLKQIQTNITKVKDSYLLFFFFSYCQHSLHIFFNIKFTYIYLWDLIFLLWAIMIFMYVDMNNCCW